jgi:hypothetical protein
LVGLTANDAYRTNLGMVNVGGQPLEVGVELYDSEDDLLASWQEQLPADGWRQLNRVFESKGLAEVDAAVAVLRNLELEGRLIGYASVVDELSGDPTFIAAGEYIRPSETAWIAAVAHVSGVGGAQWRTDLSLGNTTDLDTLITLELFQDGEVSSLRRLLIPEGFTARFDDVVAELMRADGTGALRVTIDRGLMVVASRTYAAASSGTFGQYIPAQRESEAIRAGQSALLPQLRQGGGFRTNVGLLNLAETPIVVRQDSYRASGELIASTSHSVPARSWFQANRAVPAGTASAILSSDTADARYLAYASVVDNASDDPTYLPAVPLD